MIDSLLDFFSEARKYSRRLRLRRQLSDFLEGIEEFEYVELPRRLREKAELFSDVEHFARFLLAALERGVKASRAGEYIVVYNPGVLRRLLDSLADSLGFDVFLDSVFVGGGDVDAGLAGLQEALTMVQANRPHHLFGDGTTLLVVGVSRDTGKAFTVRPPPSASVILGLTPSAVEDERMVRQALGFDLHAWEYDWRPGGGGECGPLGDPLAARVRIQGDVVLDIDCWMDDGDSLAEAVEGYLDAAASMEWASEAFRRILAGAGRVLSSIDAGNYSSRLLVDKAAVALAELVYDSMGPRAASMIEIGEAVVADVNDNPYVLLDESPIVEEILPRPARIVGFDLYARIRFIPNDVSVNLGGGRQNLVDAAPEWAKSICDTLVLSGHSDASFLSISKEELRPREEMVIRLPWTRFTSFTVYEAADGVVAVAFSTSRLYCILLYSASVLAREGRAPEVLEGFSRVRARLASGASPEALGVRIERHEATFRGFMVSGAFTDVEYLVSRYLKALSLLREYEDDLTRLSAASGQTMRRILSRRPEAALALARALSLVASVKTGVPVAFMDPSAPLTVDHPEHGMDSYSLPAPLKARLTTVNSS